MGFNGSSPDADRNHRRKDDRWRGLLLAGAAGLLFALLPVATRYIYAIEPHIDPLSLLAARFFFGTVLLWAFGPRKESLRPAAGEWFWLALSVAGLLVTTLMYFLALRTVPASVAVLLVYTYPAFIAVMARLWFGEPLGPRRLAALLLTFGGSAVLAGFSGAKLAGVPVSGMVMALASGFSYAVFSLGCQRLTVSRSALWYNRWTMTAAALIYLIIRPPLFLFNGSWRLLAGGFLLGLIPTFMAFSLYLAAIGYIGATRAALCSNTELVFAVILSWAVLGEGLTVVQALGGLMVLAGVIGIMTWREDHSFIQKRFPGPPPDPEKRTTPRSPRPYNRSCD